MVEVRVKVDERQFAGIFGTFRAQIPFTTSVAINEVMKDAQKDIRTHINNTYVVRRKAFIDRSIKIEKFAKKQDLRGLLAVSPPGGQKNDVLSQHEEGGVKTPIDGHSIAVPTENIRPDVKRVIPKGKRPRQLKKSFVKKTTTQKLLFQTVGRGRSRVVRLAYALLRSVRLKPTLKFYSTAITTISKNWNTRFNEAWGKALSSRK